MKLDHLPIREDLLRDLWHEEVGTLSDEEFAILLAMGGIKYGCDDGSSAPAREEAA